MYKILGIFLLFFIMGCSSSQSAPKYTYGDVVTVANTTTGIVTDVHQTWDCQYTYQIMFVTGHKSQWLDNKELQLFTNFPWGIADPSKVDKLLEEFEKLGIPNMNMDKST